MIKKNYNIPSSEFLSVEAARELLQCVVTPANAPHAVTQLFAGLRRVEADSASWRDLVFEQGGLIVGIDVGEPSCSRCVSFRLVPACAALQEWLQPFVGLDGLLTPDPDTARRFRRVAQEQGVALGHNVFRKTYASYRLAQTFDWAEVARELGWNRGCVFRPFCSPVTREIARSFFGLTPSACGRPEWAQEVEAWRRDGQPSLNYVHPSIPNCAT